MKFPINDPLQQRDNSRYPIYVSGYPKNVYEIFTGYPIKAETYISLGYSENIPKTSLWVENRISRNTPLLWEL